jgi:glutathione peroxidase-family protein
MGKDFELGVEAMTKNFVKYGCKKDGYVFAVYVPKVEKKPKSVKVVVEEQ